jgi:Flp pilus assembly protein TadD
MKKTIIAGLAAALLLGLTACGETTTERSVSAGAIGAAGGAALGAIGGSAGWGALAGAGAGLIGGYLYDQHERGNVEF